MGSTNKEILYTVYCYYDNETNAIYVGLTCRPKLRDYEHRNGKKSHGIQRFSSVYRYFKSIKKTLPNPKILKNNLTATEAQYWEGYYVEFYREKGMHIINIAKTGNLGYSNKVWTYDKIKETIIDNDCKDPKDLRKISETAYSLMYSNKWVDDFFPDRKQLESWTLEKVRDIVNGNNQYNKVCEKPYDLFDIDNTAFAAMYRYGWQKDIFPNWKENGRLWSLQKVRDIANGENKFNKICETPKDLQEVNPKAYNIMYYYHWQDTIFPYTEKPIKWSYEMVKDVIVKGECTKPEDLKKFNPKAHKAMYKNKWVDDFFPDRRQSETWTLEKVRDIVNGNNQYNKVCKTPQDLQSIDSNAHNAMYRYGWADEIFPDRNTATKWNVNMIIDIVNGNNQYNKVCKTLSELEKVNRKAWEQLYRHKEWLSIVFPNHVLREKWSFERIKSIIDEYNITNIQQLKEINPKAFKFLYSKQGKIIEDKLFPKA